MFIIIIHILKFIIYSITIIHKIDRETPQTELRKGVIDSLCESIKILKEIV